MHKIVAVSEPAICLYMHQNVRPPKLQVFQLLIAGGLLWGRHTFESFGWHISARIDHAGCAAL